MTFGRQKEAFFEQIIQLFARWLPPDMKDQPDTLRKASLIIGTNFVVVSFLIPYWAYESYHRGPLHPGALANLICIAGLLLMVPMIRYTRSLVWTSLIMPTLGIIALPLSMVDKGWIFADELMWFSLLPTVASFLAGPVIGLVYTIAGVATIIAIAVYQHLHTQLPHNYTTQDLIHRTVSAISIVFLAWVISAIYEVVRRAAQRRAEEAQRSTEELSRARIRFLANMSHEIRTPMNGVLATAEILLDSPLNSEQKRYAETIRQSGSDLLVIINDILDFSKIAAGKMPLDSKPTDIRTMLNDLKQIFEPLAQKNGITLVIHIDAQIPSYFRGDPIRLRQVLMNLLGNAIKFTSTGTVTLTSRYEASKTADHTISFEVTDTGIGIAADDFEKIFKPYSQVDTSAKRRYGGSGLGLAISKALVESMGGSMWFESQLGQGSTFSFQIPCHATAPESPTPMPSLRQSFNYRVLVAEDNEVNLQVLTTLLQKLGMKPEVARNGQEVLDELERHSYDVIFMDCQMPLLDGFEATQRLRQKFPNTKIKVIALTASTMPEDRQRCMQVGMDDFLPKPITRESLSRVLNNIAG